MTTAADPQAIPRDPLYAKPPAGISGLARFPGARPEVIKQMESLVEEMSRTLVQLDISTAGLIDDAAGPCSSAPFFGLLSVHENIGRLNALSDLLQAAGHRMESLVEVFMPSSAPAGGGES